MEYYLYRVEIPPRGNGMISYRDRTGMIGAASSWSQSGSFHSEQSLHINYKTAGFISMDLFNINDLETQVQISLGIIPTWVVSEVRSHDPRYFRFYLGVPNRG